MGFRGSRLVAALGLSAALHLLLIWPGSLPRTAVDRPAIQSGTLRLVPAISVLVGDAVPGGRQVGHRAPEPVRGIPSSVLLTAVVSGAPSPDFEAALPAVPEQSLRALRYAIARSVARDAAGLHAPGVRMAIEMRLHARRVVAVTLVRSSGRDTIDARVLAAFKAAASDAVIPDNLPADGFAVELELDGGPADSNNDEQSLAPG